MHISGVVRWYLEFVLAVPVVGLNLNCYREIYQFPIVASASTSGKMKL
jgi:hypothetical protein